MQEKPQYRTVYHVKSEWAALRGHKTPTCMPCGLVRHFFVSLLSFCLCDEDVCLPGDARMSGGDFAAQNCGDIVKLNREKQR